MVIEDDPHDETVPALLDGCSELRRLRWSFSLVVGFVVYQLKVGVVIGVPLGFWAGTQGMRPAELLELLTTPTPLGYTVLALSELALLAIALFASTGFYPRPVGLTWQGAGRSLLLLGPLMGVMAFMVYADPTVSVQRALESELLPYVVVLCVLIGLTEELVFRGLLIGILGGSRAPIFAAVVSAALFGLVHVATLGLEGAWVAWTIFGLAGVPFALVYLRTGSILGIAIVHAVWDMVILGSRGLAQPTSADSVIEPSAFVLPGVVAVAYLTWFWLTERGLAAIPNPLRAKRERSTVNWDELADDEVVNPWIKAQLRAAASE